MKQFDVPAMVEADPEANATDLLVDRVKATPDGALFAIPTDDGGWRDVTAREFHRQVIALAKGFVAAGIEPGDKIALMAKTSYEWTLIDFAVWFAGATIVPVYETSAPAQILWNLTDSGAIAMITETADHFARFDEIRADAPAVRDVWQLGLGDLDKLVASGKDVTDEEIERRRNLAKGSDLATLIYTSGSTGKPKGCVLTHSNFVELCRNAQRAIPEVVNPNSTTLLFITLAHIFARFISVLAITGGVKVGHQPDTKLLVPSMGSFKPTFLLAVPRVFEKVYNASEQKAEAGGKGKIFRKAVDVAIEHSKALDAGKVPFGLKLQYAVFNKLVLSKIKAALGGRAEYAVSGSAPLGLRLGHFYRSLGLTILEGYGLTETAAPVSVNLPSNFKIGTVGPPLPGNSVRIAAEGEIQVKGVCVFEGYWKNDAANKESFTDDGWFRTGDVGEFDDDGYLTITGRIKEMIVTAGGKNVAPAVLEDPIRANPIVGQVVAVGDRKPFISALITLDDEMLPVWLNNNGEDANMSLADAAKHPKVLAEVQTAVDAANARVSRAESIRKFTILDTTFTEANYLTPKLSIKRHEIVKDYADQIEALYAGAPATEGITLG